ncbi:MAG: dienelactone hydrolase family protein [Muribaculaceae bacterium]|nr:dienelactone hydrolase family protein [Muribaculaceae bacterium]
MKKLILVLLAMLSYPGIHAETIKTKQVDDGGTGMFKAVAVKDSEMPDFVIYRPQDLMLAHARQGELPVLMWGNGACLDSSIDYERFLTEIASHGYIVMAIGELQENRDDRKAGHSESSELKRGLDWIIRQASTKGSDYYNNIDTLKIAAAGHSCGGAQVLANAADQRLKTCLIMNAGMGDIEMAGASRESLPKVHTPILYVTGGPDDIAYHNARMDFERLIHVPVALADHPASGHGGTYGQQNGGDYARLAVDWLDWQLKGNNDNAETFLGGEAKGYDGWTISAKNFVDLRSMTLVDPVPDVRKALPIGSVPMGSLDNFAEYQLDLEMEDGRVPRER